MLLKATTGSSVHSGTSGTFQLIQNEPKQVKDATEGFNSKYTKLPYLVCYGCLYRLVDIVWECVFNAYFNAKELDY